MHRRCPGLLVLALLAGMVPGAGWGQWGPFGYRPLPSSLDLMETGLYWLQDLSRPGRAGDPASLLGAAQELAARRFDFAELAWRTAGLDYLRRDLLARSHFQHRLRDRLFLELAHGLGLYDPLPPRIQLLPPLTSGDGRAVLSVLVWTRQRPLQRLDFHLRDGVRGWRIVAVASNGVLFSDYLRARGFR